MSASASDHLKQIDELLATGNHSWLFGAGISLNAGLPLMGPLTDRILSMADAHTDKTVGSILKETKDLLPSGSHIEHILSHLCDYIAITDRSASPTVKIGTTEIDCDALRKLHATVLTWIAETIRWGYVPAKGSDPERVGDRDSPIVTVEHHIRFMKCLFDRSHAGLGERRAAVKFFTINYDTLLEDALSLCCIAYWDGLSGGAVGYRCYHYGEAEPSGGYRAHVVKLHGSIDWHLCEDERVWRVRDGDIYPSRTARVLIYPQATKYLATQRDPFAAQFDLLRRTLSANHENVLSICGYSFGDEHINQELELALQRSDNKTTTIAFSQKMPPVLDQWRQSHWGKRLYILTEDGLYVGADGPFAPPTTGGKHQWWTFTGVSDLLSHGAEASVS